jgi:hypothetical protein
MMMMMKIVTAVYGVFRDDPHPMIITAAMSKRKSVKTIE